MSSPSTSRTVALRPGMTVIRSVDTSTSNWASTGSSSYSVRLGSRMLSTVSASKPTSMLEPSGATTARAADASWSGLKVARNAMSFAVKAISLSIMRSSTLAALSMSARVRIGVDSTTGMSTDCFASVDISVVIRARARTRSIFSPALGYEADAAPSTTSMLPSKAGFGIAACSQASISALIASSLKPMDRSTSSLVLNDEIQEAKLVNIPPSRLTSMASATARSVAAVSPTVSGESLNEDPLTVKTPVLWRSSCSYACTATSASDSLNPPTGMPAMATLRAISSSDVARSAQ